MTSTEDKARLDKATRAFHESTNYHLIRDKYESETVKYMLRKIEVLTENDELDPFYRDTGLTVLELGCGTGLLTETVVKVLSGKRVEYIASDPLQTMENVFKEEFPDVKFIPCVAESIPLPDNSVDVILGAASFHWFPTIEAYKEIYRVLRPYGRVGYIGNDIPHVQNSPPWYKPLNELLVAAYDKSGAPWARDKKWSYALVASKLFRDLTEDFTRTYHQDVGPEIAIRCLSSWGGVASGTSEDRKMFTQKVTELIDEHFTNNGVKFPGLQYVPEIYHCRTIKTE